MLYRFTRSVVICLLLCLAGASSADAGHLLFARTNDFLVGIDDTLDSELWMAAETVDIKGTVADDLFLMSPATKLSGRFRNDVWCMGDSILIDGYIQEHARLAAAKSIEVTGQIDLSLIALANTAKVDEKATIGGHVYLMGENVMLEGHIGGGARLLGYQATIGGIIEGDVEVIAEDIIVLPKTQITGDLTYRSTDELILDPQVKLTGKLIRLEPEATSGASVTQRFYRLGYFFLAALVAGSLWVAIFRRNSARAVGILRAGAWRCMLIGLIAFGLIPMISAFAVITIVGIPLAILCGAVYLVLLYTGPIIVALALGSALLRHRGQQTFGQIFSGLTLGLMILYGAAILPGAASTIWFLTTILGLGAMILSIMMPDIPPVLPKQQETLTPPNQEGERSEDSKQEPEN